MTDNVRQLRPGRRDEPPELAGAMITVAAEALEILDTISVPLQHLIFDLRILAPCGNQSQMVTLGTVAQDLDLIRCALPGMITEAIQTAANEGGFDDCS